VDAKVDAKVDTDENSHLFGGCDSLQTVVAGRRELPTLGKLRRDGDVDGAADRGRGVEFDGEAAVLLA
jgi:hypothetical protein